MNSKRFHLLDDATLNGEFSIGDDLVRRLDKDLYDDSNSKSINTYNKKLSNKKSQTKTRKTIDPNEEQFLESIVFGNQNDMFARINQNGNLVSDCPEDISENSEIKNQFFIIDKIGHSNVYIDDDEERNNNNC